MIWIISDVLSQVLTRKSRGSFQQLIGLPQLLVFTTQLGYRCNKICRQRISSAPFATSRLRPSPNSMPRDTQVGCHDLARFLYGLVLSQDAVFHKADRSILCILFKFLWHSSEFPIYSDGTKPGALLRQSTNALSVSSQMAAMSLLNSSEESLKDISNS